MKYCPSCRIEYADDTLRFCLQDGTGLLDYSENAPPTRHWSEKETVVRKTPVTTGFEPVRGTQGATNQPESKNSGSFLPVIVTALAMSLLFGGMIVGWQLFGGKSSDNKNLTVASPTNTSSPTPTKTPVPTLTKTIDRNQNDLTDDTFKPRLEWTIDENLSFNEGERITYYRGTTVEACQADCARNPKCVAFTLIRAGAYNPQDPPMCYLMSKVTSSSKSSCCISGIRTPTGGIGSGSGDGAKP